MGSMDGLDPWIGSLDWVEWINGINIMDRWMDWMRQIGWIARDRRDQWMDLSDRWINRWINGWIKGWINLMDSIIWT